MAEIDCKPVAGHYTGAGDELDVEDLYTKYKVYCTFSFTIYYIRLKCIDFKSTHTHTHLYIFLLHYILLIPSISFFIS